MNISEYLSLVSNRLKMELEKENIKEVVRILNLLKEVIDEQIGEYSKCLKKE